MKRRLTLLAVIVLLLDVLALGAAWRAGPTLALAAALAVPDVEPILARLVGQPVREETGAGMPGSVLYRSSHPRSAVLLLPEGLPPDDPDLRRAAAALARHDIAVLVPEASVVAVDDTPARDLAVALGRMLDVPARVERVSALRLSRTGASPVERAAEGMRLLRLVETLLGPR